MTPHRLLVLSAAFAMLSAPAFAQPKPNVAAPTIPESQLNATPSFSPYAFLTTAASANDFEIRAAKLAVERAEDPEVKAFAQKMLDDHTAAQEKLVAAGAADGVEVATPGVDGDQDGMLSQLEAATGAEFDRIYVETQVAAHNRAVSLHQGYTDGTTKLHEFAKQTLPALQAHYDEVVAIATRMEIPLQAQ